MDPPILTLDPRQWQD